MTARIVYDGVQTGSAGGGDLFQGMRFFVTQRVPLRDHYVQLIESNGGRIAALDKSADIVIADHLRKKFTPAGSISYTFIDACIKEGKLQDIENHRAGEVPPDERNQPNQQQSRAAPVKVGKVGRVPFTASDDRILMDWCSQKEREGAPMGGNVIYMHLAAQYPHHTAQSWRDRWVKRLQFQERPTAENGEQEKEEAFEPSPPRPKVKKTVSRQAGATPADSNLQSDIMKPKTKTSASVPSNTAPRSYPVAPRRVGNSLESGQRSANKSHPVSMSKDFSNDDVQKLLDSYDDILNLDDDKVIDAWLAWANLYPNHTAQEWRNYFNKKIKGKRSSSKPTEQKAPPTSVSASRVQKRPKAVREPSPESEISSPSRQLAQDAQNIPANQRSSPSKTPTSESNKVKKANKTGPEADSPIKEVKDSQGSSNRTISSVDAVDIVDAPLPSHANDSVEDRFIQNLTAFSAHLFPGYVLNLDPAICGSRVKLFDIYSTIFSEDFLGPIEIDRQQRWPEVAQRLGFERSIREKAGSELRDCYNEILSEFNAAVNTMEEEEVSASQADQMVAEQLQSTAGAAGKEDDYENVTGRDDLDDDVDGADQEHDDDLNAPQYSPFVAAGKRPHAPDFTPSPNKRFRLDKGKDRLQNMLEVPSTPEEDTKLAKDRTVLMPSPFSRGDDLYGNEAEEELSIQSPSRTRPKSARRISDPKTQDFRFQDAVPEVDEEDQMEEQALQRIKPSHQQHKRLPLQSNENSANQNSLSTHGPSQTGSSTQSQTASQKQNGLDEFIESAGAMGYSPDIISEALKSTSVVTGTLATSVMESIFNGNGIPKNTRGVWTLGDDNDLKKWLENKKSQRPRYEKLVEKHGRQGVKERKAFLKNYED